MDELPPLFEDSQMLDESELVVSLTNKAPRTHKAMLIAQGNNPDSADLETFMENLKARRDHGRHRRGEVCYLRRGQWDKK